MVLGHARRFGNGDVRLTTGTLRMTGERVQARIGGDYFQGTKGTLQLRVSRVDGGLLQSDSLLVAGRAELGGTLQLTATGRVQLRLGERVTLVTPEVRMFWQHETLEGSPWVASRFASGAGGVFRLRGTRLGRESLVGSVSVTAQLGGNGADMRRTRASSCGPTARRIG